MRSRSVSHVVLTATVDVPAPPTRLDADWTREITLAAEAAIHRSLVSGRFGPVPVIHQ